MQNNLREIRKVIYRLKRQYGLRLLYIRPLTAEQDIDTGEIKRTFEQHEVKRAILLPSKIDRSFVYDLTFIAANNNFVGGAFFDQSSRIILVDGKDMPFTPTLNDHVEFEGERYEIAEINVTAGHLGYLFRVRGLSNSNTVGT